MWYLKTQSRSVVCTSFPEIILPYVSTGLHVWGKHLNVSISYKHTGASYENPLFLSSRFSRSCVTKFTIICIIQTARAATKLGETKITAQIVKNVWTTQKIQRNAQMKNLKKIKTDCSTHDWGFWKRCGYKWPVTGQLKVLKTLNGRQSYILSKFHKIERF